MLKKKDFVNSLKELGLKKNDVVLLHSSINALGPIEGGAEMVIDAFMEVLGNGGALIVPVFGKLGIITEIIRARKDAVVSNAPVGTLAGIGKKAAKLLAGHWDAETAHGEGSPFLKIAEAGGYVCLMGVDQDRNTMLHSAEAMLELPYLGEVTKTCANPKGKQVTRTWKYYPGPHRNFIGLDALFAGEGIMSVTRIGNAQVRLIQAREMLELAMEEGENDAAFVLCDNPECADCVQQRAKIFAAWISQESFILSASSKLCGRYVPEMIENLNKAGISNVELDYVQGKACATMDAARLKAVVAEFAAAKITVTGLRAFAVPEEPEAFAEKCIAAGIRRVLLPLHCQEEVLAALAKKKLAVEFFNSGMGSVEAAARFKALSAKKKCGFVMSPPAFVLAGENPFLKSWRKGHFVKGITQLDVADCTWDAEATVLAGGNAEIKELISILRCQNFSGYMTLGGGAVYVNDLMETRDNFICLIQEM